MTRSIAALALALVLAAPARAEGPLSAIDWLSDSIRTPPKVEAPAAPPAEGAPAQDVEVSPIGAPDAEAVGLLPVSVTGFAPDLWAASTDRDLAARLGNVRADLMPAMLDLYYQLLLAELDPPQRTAAEPVFLLARIDALLGLGAVEQAGALIERAGTRTPELFRREFDISLLLRTEERTCARMRDTPALSPTFTARIYCLARTGDWAAAALALETGRALGFVSDKEDALLAHFLDLGLEDELPPLEIPVRPSPLEFRIFEAIGRPLPTTDLPQAFAHTDLHAATGWKTQIESAERLARTRAIDANRLLGLYTQRKPAASGGVWDRVAAIQALDAALLSNSSSALSLALVQAWRAMAAAELEPVLARSFCPRLAGRSLPDEARRLRLRLCLLAGERGARMSIPADLDQAERLALAIDTGNPGTVSTTDPFHAAILDGFARTGIPVRLRSLVDRHRMGEAMLRAIELFAQGTNGDLDELTDALVFLRSIGQEDTARQAAIELILLERSG